MFVFFPEYYIGSGFHRPNCPRSHIVIWPSNVDVKTTGPTVIHSIDIHVCMYIHMGVSKNNGTPKSSILIGFSIINHPFWGTIIFGNIHVYTYTYFVRFIFESF